MSWQAFLCRSNCHALPTTILPSVASTLLSQIYVKNIDHRRPTKCGSVFEQNQKAHSAEMNVSSTFPGVAHLDVPQH